jgi:hypothetical protein
MQSIHRAAARERGTLASCRAPLRLAVLLGIAACASQSASAPPVQVCVGSCAQKPVAPTPETCSIASARYQADGTPTECFYITELNRVAEPVKACSSGPGVIAVEYRFALDGTPRGLRAVADCNGCQLPAGADRERLLRCVEQAAAAARLPLSAERSEFYVVFPYRVGAPDDPRLNVGWSPMEPTH